MSNIITSLGTVVSTKVISSGRTIATINFNRTNTQGFPVLDNVFLAKDKSIGYGQYAFDLVFNTQGNAIIDLDGKPVIDDNGKPRTYKTDSIFAVGFTSTNQDE